jgi:hypothetical protein
MWRLLLICAIAATAETIFFALEAYDVMMWAGVLAGAGAYVLTQDLDTPRGRGGRRGEIKYWRGRRVDDDDGPRRWN